MGMNYDIVYSVFCLFQLLMCCYTSLNNENELIYTNNGISVVCLWLRR